jgi:hypothetical protein
MITAVAEGGTTTTIEDTIVDTTIGTLPGVTTIIGDHMTTEGMTGTTIGRGVTTAGTSARGADETAVAF